MKMLFNEDQSESDKNSVWNEFKAKPQSNLSEEFVDDSSINFELSNKAPEIYENGVEYFRQARSWMFGEDS